MMQTMFRYADHFQSYSIASIDCAHALHVVTQKEPLPSNQVCALLLQHAQLLVPQKALWMFSHTKNW